MSWAVSVTNVDHNEVISTLRNKFEHDWGNVENFEEIDAQFQELLLATGDLLDLLDPNLSVHAELRGHVYQEGSTIGSDISIMIGEHR
jgi:hypothetical protein